MQVDLVIVGGGLAGLTAGIAARRAGLSVVLVEKKRYPFHKVCGEYISNESRELLCWLGVPIGDWKLPEIQRFELSHPSGKPFTAKLPLGGFGLSRFTLDHFLANQLRMEGGIVLEGTKTTATLGEGQGAYVSTTHPVHPKIIASFCLGAFGRNKPDFAQKSDSQSNKGQYIGVKYHLKGDFPRDLIGLHHFPGGYCGISAIENDKLCLCYLLQRRMANRYKGDFEKIEMHLLRQNPRLKEYLDFEKCIPAVSTSGIHFEARPLFQDNMLFSGDSAGMIPPLAGNGMSMAMHSAIIAMELIYKSLDNNALQAQYSKKWTTEFATRLQTGRRLQKLMEKEWLVAATIGAFRLFPPLFQFTAKCTHGSSIPIPDFLPSRP